MATKTKKLEPSAFQNAAINAGVPEDKAILLPAEWPADRNAVSTAVRTKTGIVGRDLKEIVDLIETERPQAATPVIPVSEGEGEEEAKSVKTDQAKPGETAVKKNLKRSSDLARQLNLPVAHYVGCSRCRNDLDEYAAEEGVRVDQMTQCPYCSALFVVEQKVACYSCGTNMPSTGVCVQCGGKKTDSEALKIATIEVRRTSGKTGRPARAEAKTVYLGDEDTMALLVAQARAEKWISKVEEEGISPSQLGRGGPSASAPFRGF